MTELTKAENERVRGLCELIERASLRVPPATQVTVSADDLVLFRRAMDLDSGVVVTYLGVQVIAA